MNRLYKLTLLLLLAQLATAQSNLYDLKHIVTIRIDFKEDHWHRRLDSLKEAGYEARLIADVKVDDKLFPGAGVRYKGNSSYFSVRNDGYRKLPFNIKVNHTDKALSLPGGLTTLKLSNVFRDPSFVREVLAYEIARKYMPAPRANFAKVYVDGEYMGLYNLSESIDEEYLAKYYGQEEGLLIKCDPTWDGKAIPGCPPSDYASLQYLGEDTVCYRQFYELKDKRGWKELSNLTYTLDQRPTLIDSILNVDEALWMLAFNNVLVNLDSYIGKLCHNYYLYLDNFGIWHPLVWDMNLCFGGFRYTGLGPLSNEQLQQLSPFLHFMEKNPKRPLVTKLLSDEHHRKIYLAHMKTLVEENFANGWYKERIEAIRKLVAAEVKADSNRLYDYEAFQKNWNETVKVQNNSIVGITELMDKRSEYLLAHPLLQKPAPKIATVKHLAGTKSTTITANISDATAAWVYHRPNKADPWRSVELTADESGVWKAQLPKTSQHYYVVAENEAIASLSPARASREFYDVSKPVAKN